MASKIADAFVEIGARTSKFKKSLAGVRASTARIGKGLVSLGKTALAFGAIAATGGTLAVRAFAKQEEAENNLRSALKNTGLEVENNLAKFKAFASEVQNTTKFGDEMVLGLVAQARNLGVAEDQLESTTKGAIGMAKALGIDLNSAIRNTALALQGEFTILQRYVPALRQTTDATEKMAIVQELMNSGFEQAKDETKTLSGSFVQLKNDLGDVLEKTGQVIAENLNLTENFQKLRTVVKKIPRAVNEMIKIFILGSLDINRRWSLLGENIRKVWAETSGAVTKGFVFMFNTGRRIAENLKMTWLGFVAGTQTAFLSLQKTFSNVMAGTLDVLQAFIERAEQLPVVGEKFGGMAAKIRGVKNAFSDSAESIQRDIDGINNKLGEEAAKIEENKQNLKAGFADIDSQTQKTIKGIERRGEAEREELDRIEKEFLDGIIKRATAEANANAKSKKGNNDVTNNALNNNKKLKIGFISVVDIFKKLQAATIKDNGKVPKGIRGLPGVERLDKEFEAQEKRKADAIKALSKEGNKSLKSIDNTLKKGLTLPVAQMATGG